MPDSLDTTIAKAIVTALQDASDAAEFSQTFDAERIYFPLFDPEKSRALRVVVIQKEYTKVIQTRADDDNTVVIDVVICKPLGQLNPTSDEAITAIDAMRYFTEELMLFLLRKDLGGSIGSIISVSVGNGELMDDAALTSGHVYLSPIQATITTTN